MQKQSLEDVSSKKLLIFHCHVRFWWTSRYDQNDPEWMAFWLVHGVRRSRLSQLPHSLVLEPQSSPTNSQRNPPPNQQFFSGKVFHVSFFGCMLFGFPLICEGTKFWFLNLHPLIPNPTQPPSRTTQQHWPKKKTPRSRTSFFNSNSACFPWREKTQAGEKKKVSFSLQPLVFPCCQTKHPTIQLPKDHPKKSSCWWSSKFFSHTQKEKGFLRCSITGKFPGGVVSSSPF